MPRTLVAFDHLDESFAAGDFVHEDHELVRVAPHLFEQPEPEPEPDPNIRIRGPLVKPPRKPPEVVDVVDAPPVASKPKRTPKSNPGKSAVNTTKEG